MARNTAAGLAMPQEVPGELVHVVAKLVSTRLKLVGCLDGRNTAAELATPQEVPVELVYVNAKLANARLKLVGCLDGQEHCSRINLATRGPSGVCRCCC